nr:hypothetical protein RVX_1085 [Nitratidesulfovibrio sp. HK-II]
MTNLGRMGPLDGWGGVSPARRAAVRRRAGALMLFSVMS